MTTPDILAVLTHTLTRKQLAERLETNTREVELGILQARLEGAAIVSDSHGYRLSTDPSEVYHCARRLRVRAIHQLLTARALRRTARRMEGIEQRTLGLVA